MRKFYFLAGILFFILMLNAAVLGADIPAREYFNRASIQYLMGNYQQAINDLNNCLKIDPANKGAQKLLKSIESERKQVPSPSQFIPAEEREKRINEYLEKGKKSHSESDFASAATYFRGALSLSPGNPTINFYLKKSRQMQEQIERERTAYLLFALVLFAIGFVLLLFMASYVSVKLKRVIEASYRQKKHNRCFSCGSKISPNIDLCPNCGAWIGTKMRKSIFNEQSKWYAKWGWKKNPFTLDIHPELFTGYRNEVRTILEKINARSGHVLITGPLGVGKTTLLRWLSSHLANDFLAVYVSRPPQDFNLLIKLIIQRMNINVNHLSEYDVYHLDRLRRKAGKNLVILLDEAHEFTIDIERPLRTLGDLDEVKLVMAGLPETVDKFKNEIRPLYERLVLNIALKHLESNDLKELIKARVENAGGEGTHPFTTDALDKIYLLSQGIPRVAVKICDWAVTKAITNGEDKISAEFISGWSGTSQSL